VYHVTSTVTSLASSCCCRSLIVAAQGRAIAVTSSAVGLTLNALLITAIGNLQNSTEQETGVCDLLRDGSCALRLLSRRLPTDACQILREIRMQHHSKLAPDEAARFIQSWYVAHPSRGENMVLSVCLAAQHAFPPARALRTRNLIPAKVRGAEGLGPQRARAAQRSGALGNLHEVEAAACGRCAWAVQAARNVT
jgi:hypothetical protein